jgi:hypothetical protein
VVSGRQPSQFLTGTFLKRGMNNLWLERKLELTVACQVAQGESSLALNLKTRAVHELDEILNKFRLALSKFLPVHAWWVISAAE